VHGRYLRHDCDYDTGPEIHMATDRGWINVSEHIGLGTDVKPLAAVDPDGGLHWVYRKSEVERALLQVGIRAGTMREAFEAEERETPEQRAEREAKEKLEEEIRKETQRRLGLQVLKALERRPDAVMRLLVW